MPNPTGADKGGEYVVIFNNSTHTLSLAGWRLQNAKGKTVSIGQFVLSPAQQIKLQGPTLGLTLGNTKDSITLLAPNGEVGDVLSYGSPAAEGVPLLHAGELTAEVRAMLFDEFEPHPLPAAGSANGAALSALLTAAILAGISVYVLRHIKKDAA